MHNSLFDARNQICASHKEEIMSIAETFPRLNDEAAKYPKPSTMTKPFLYGTAGFRTDAELLRSTLHRMGMLAVLRSKHQGKVSW